MTWAPAAQTYCSLGYRLPTLRELLSLVDLTVTSAATINQTAFPHTPTEFFWASSPYVPSPGNVWGVFFGQGGAVSDAVGDNSRARCVR